MAAIVAAAVLACAYVAARAPAAACVRENKPWASLVAFEATPAPPKLYLAVFHPQDKSADLVFIPDSTVLPDGRALASVRKDSLDNDADPAGAAKDEADAARELLWPLLGLDADGASDRFVYVAAGPSDEPDPALDGASWARRLPWRLALGRKGLRANVGRAERLEAALELWKAGAGRLRPAWLPEEAALRRAYLGRLVADKPLPAPARLTVEVLNATGRHGIAQEATKVLRSGGADVVASSNASRLQSRTVIYDKAGSFAGASAVKKILGCREAAVVSRPDARRLVDVSVVVGDDCADVIK